MVPVVVVVAAVGVAGIAAERAGARAASADLPGDSPAVLQRQRWCHSHQTVEKGYRNVIID